MSLFKTDAGGVLNGANLTGAPQIYVINTLLNHYAGVAGDITVAGNVPGAHNLQLLAEHIQQKVNMKYIHVSAEEVDLSVAGNRTFYGFGADFNQAATTVYTIKFLAEQQGFLSVDMFNELVDGLEAIYATDAVPADGGAVTLVNYDTSDADAKNTVMLSFTNI